MSDTKKCKHCQTDIPKKANVCPNCRKKQRNPLGIPLLIIGIFLLVMGLSSFDSSPSDSTSDTNQGNSSNVELDTTNNLTPEKFNSIDFDMSYDDVVALIGEDGEPVSEATVGDVTTSIYQWGDGFENFNVTFQNDKVIGKAQAGIIVSSTEVTLDMYNTIKNGMSYNDVVTAFGGEGAFLSNSKVMTMVTEIYMWPGTSLGANCNITFQDGKVIAKAQFGLE